MFNRAKNRRRLQRRIPLSRTPAFQALERRLNLYAVVGWNGAALAIGNAGTTGESVVVSVSDAGFVVVKTENGVTYWDGANQDPKVTPQIVTSITVTGSGYKDYIDLADVTNTPNIWNAAMARGSITVNCSATIPNLTTGDKILLGGFGESAIGSPYADTIECDPNLSYGDTANGGGGADTITGGAGNDSLTVGGTGIGPGFNDRYARIDGGGGNDTIKGGNMQSKLYGDDGNDTITVGPYGDLIDGGDGSDTLNGGPGVDTIYGGGGDDIINGKGAPIGAEDIMRGGTGNNWYYFNDNSPAFGHDVANDYDSPEGNHPKVGGIRFIGANDNGTEDDGNAWITEGTPIGLLATKLTIPVPDPGKNGQPRESISTVSYYLDTVDANGNPNPDGFLQQWDNGGDQFLGSSIPDLAVSVNTGGKNPWKPGTYTFFAIATATNGYQGNYWKRDITIVGPKVGINAVVPQTQELLAGQPGVFDVTRDGPTDSALTVNYTLSGTATNGTDYSTLSGTVTIPAGSADATIDVSPLDDGDGDDGAASESVIATLTSTSGDYQIDPDASSATVNIAEEDPPTVSISADIPNAVENDASQDGEYTISRTGPTDEALTVNLAASGTAVAGTNYAGLPTSVTIPAGSQTAVLQVAAMEDSPDGNGPETVTETIQPGSNYTIGSPSSADVSILEQPTSTVTIAATTPTTAEDSGTPGEFTVTRTAPYDSALTVAYSMSGTAINGTDYQTLSGSVTIPANAPSVVFDVVPLDDGGDAGEPASSVATATITPDPNQSYLVGAANSDSVTIGEEAPPQVSISTATAQISENGSAGTFKVTRSDPTDEPLTVYYAFSGTAQAGTDFTDPGGSVTIPAGWYYTTITIAPLDDGDGDETQSSESLTATLSPSPTYELTSYSSATMTINEEPIPQVTVAWQSDAVENPASSGSFLVTRTGPTTDPLTVSFNLGGTAIAGTDYTSVGTTVTIPAGQSSAPITIAPIDDQQDEPSETVTVTIVNQPGVYAAVSPSSAQLTIVEDGTPTVNITAASPTISETGPGTGFIVSRTGSLGQPLTVDYQTNAGDPGDFQPLSGQVTIPAGQASAAIDVYPNDDGDNDDSQTSSQVSVTLIPSQQGSYNVGQQSSATITIDEEPLPSVTIGSMSATAVEGGASGTLVVGRTGPLNDPLEVYYSVAGTANGGNYYPLSGNVTIAANASWAVIDITALEDGPDQSGETVTVSLEAQGGYQVGAASSQTVYILEQPASAVTISADSNAAEYGASGQFTVTRTAPYDLPLTVTYEVGGSAVAGTDYQALSGTVTIPAGSNTAAITVAPIADSGADGEDGITASTVVVTLTAPQDLSYNLGSKTAATVNVNEEPQPIVSIAADAVEMAASRMDRSRDLRLNSPRSMASKAVTKAPKPTQYQRVNCINVLPERGWERAAQAQIRV